MGRENVPNIYIERNACVVILSCNVVLYGEILEMFHSCRAIFSDNICRSRQIISYNY